MKALILSIATLFFSGCITTSVPPSIDESYVLSKTHGLQGNDAHLDALSVTYKQKAKPDNRRKLIVFMDGTGNTVTTNTNIWKMYKLSVMHAREGHAVVPYYLEGVGTDHWYTKIVGGAFGDGINKKIQEGYQFLVENYREGDEIFLFGFSRGAYTARSLNGLIEFAGLIDIGKINKKFLSKEVRNIYNSYHVLNDGTPDFEYRLSQSLKQIYAKKIHDEKVSVTAIGVYDTVAALGLVRDDFPDDHRTNLYAKEAYHALSLDEQRDDFRLLRFDDYNLDGKSLKEVWFPGVHADVGGGYDDSDELDSITRYWMLKQFKKHELFAVDKSPAECRKSNTCYAGRLHDAFFDSKLFGRFGISRRRPRPTDLVHQSVICRMEIPTLPEPHPRREIIRKGNPIKEIKEYKPFNLERPVRGSYIIEGEDSYACAYEMDV